jgi:hypothetical protein
MLSTTIKAAAAIGIIAYAASQWAYSQADRVALAKLTAEATARFEPSTTGSIMQAAQATRVDPCNGEPLR